jgi:hypothetical protein
VVPIPTCALVIKEPRKKIKTRILDRFFRTVFILGGFWGLKHNDLKINTLIYKK